MSVNNFGKSGNIIEKKWSILLYGFLINYEGISKVIFQKGFVQ